ncbi:Inositol-pentakisphosphate 2-kinase [Serendipita sp. 399]|nr:Inositol-pentakisphosphate 2-kinase [Serendipita sp. 399]
MSLQKAEHDPTTTEVTDWAYISEGGATMVFSYVGQKHPVFTRRVLRVRKIALGHSDTKNDDQRDEEPDDPSIAFQNSVIALLLPSSHLPKLESVHVNRQWLSKMALYAKDKRPDIRKLKDDIDLSREKAVLATDLVGGRGWAVEIKPKWAFLPNQDYLSPETRETKLRNCRFCMHSMRKVSEGDQAAVGYCPLDLFSGDKDRVSKALTSLWDAWIRTDGHINNLKVFVEGKLIEPKNAVEHLAPNLSIPASSDLADILPAFQKALLPLLTESQLLSEMSHLQRSLDALDIEGLRHFWLNSRLADGSPDSAVGANLPDPSIPDWVEFVNDYLSNGKTLPTVNNNNTMDDSTLRSYIMAYLLSATFKDCSVILRLGAGDIEDSITAIDLDPKKVDRLGKWEDQDKKIVYGFKDAFERGEVDINPCSDAGR